MLILSLTKSVKRIWGRSFLKLTWYHILILDDFRANLVFWLKGICENCFLRAVGELKTINFNF
jgi:hypothetical protein